MNLKPDEDTLYARIRALNIPLWGISRLLGEGSPHPSTLSRMLRNLTVFPRDVRDKIEKIIQEVEKEKSSHV